MLKIIVERAQNIVGSHGAHLVGALCRCAECGLAIVGQIEIGAVAKNLLSQLARKLPRAAVLGAEGVGIEMRHAARVLPGTHAGGQHIKHVNTAASVALGAAPPALGLLILWRRRLSRSNQLEYQRYCQRQHPFKQMFAHNIYYRNINAINYFNANIRKNTFFETGLLYTY